MISRLPLTFPQHFETLLGCFAHSLLPPSRMCKQLYVKKPESANPAQMVRDCKRKIRKVEGNAPPASTDGAGLRAYPPR